MSNYNALPLYSPDRTSSLIRSRAPSKYLFTTFLLTFERQSLSDTKRLSLFKDRIFIMSWTVENSFEDNNVKMLLLHLNLYSFKIGELDTRISIRTYQEVGNDQILFDQSHFIITPIQAGRYITDVNHGETEGIAVHRAVNTIANFYNAAVAAGHTPSEEWLVENECFNDLF
jgi:hypothetical protein